MVENMPGTRRSAGSPHEGPAAAHPSPSTTRRVLRETGDLTLNRAERRASRRDHRAELHLTGRRVATQVAKGAVAVGLAFGVGGFAMASERGQRTPVDTLAEVDAATLSSLSPAALRERQEAVGLAATAAAQATDARTAAQASAVAGTHFASLDEAVAQLDTELAVTQQSQPALTQLSPVADDPAPVVLAPEPAAESVGESAPLVAETADATVVEDPAAARLRSVTERVEALTEQMRLVTQLTDQAAAEEAARLAAEEAARLAAEQAAAEAAEAQRKAEQAASLDAYENGKVPADALCGLDFTSGAQLRCDAAEALDALNAAYRERFGVNMVISDSYRSYESQVACVAAKGGLCATPGTSNHGNGTAVDLGGKLSSFGTVEHTWLLEHAQEYGWDLPSWARANGSKPEPWHWEFTP